MTTIDFSRFCAIWRRPRLGGLAVVIWLAVLVTTGVRADDLKSELREGTWTHLGIRNILGGGADWQVTLKRAGEGWTITYATITKSEIQTAGPYAVTVDDDTVVIDKGEGKPRERFTFLCNERYFVMPALIRRAPSEWVMVQPEYGTLVIRCDADPFKTPVGTASVSVARPKVKAIAVRILLAAAITSRAVPVPPPPLAPTAGPAKGMPSPLIPRYRLPQWYVPQEASLFEDRPLPFETKSGYFALETLRESETPKVMLRILDRQEGEGLKEKLHLAFEPNGYTSLRITNPRFTEMRLSGGPGGSGLEYVYGSGTNGQF
jgi:hypothetical protein